MHLRTFLFLAFILVTVAGNTTPKPDIVAAVRKLPAEVLTDTLAHEFKTQTWRTLRARGDVANQLDVATWRKVKTRKDWETLREDKLKRLRATLGLKDTPPVPNPLPTQVTGKVKGEGFIIENLVYQTRPDIWVTANLYMPAKPAKKMPGILIAHSHHRPKTQGELQDMGMTWARAGCLVLVIDQLGHGERADHPFQSEADYRVKNSGFRWWRQDYYYRFDLNVQLHLTGQSLMGWMAWDLMRGVDLLLAQPGIDPTRIILLGAVAGGGDPASVTAALDRRITGVVPFNFGGPQPETRYPLPEDAALHFNYLGGAYWEGTRNLRRSGVDGFFHWSIVASAAPRALVYAHEFAWDKERDPVWKRLNTIYGFYDAVDRIDYTRGRGSVKGKAPESTHCTNIGVHHRKRIHQAFARWFDIQVTPETEYSQRLEPEQLRSMTSEVRKNLQPQKLFIAADKLAEQQIVNAQKNLTLQPNVRRLSRLRSDWRAVLGDIAPRPNSKVLSRQKEPPRNGFSVERIALQTEPGIVVPMILLQPAKKKPSRVAIAVAQSGKERFLRERADAIASLLNQGVAVCLPDVRGAGTSRGSRGELGSASYYALFFETPLTGLRLRDLRGVLQYLRTRSDLQFTRFALWGDSFTPPNAPDTNFKIPKRVSTRRPRFSEPLGGLLALGVALFENDVDAVYVNGGLAAYRDVLSGPFVYIPHDVVLPGLLTRSDLPLLVTTLAHHGRRIHLQNPVDGLNRPLPLKTTRALHSFASKKLTIGNGTPNPAKHLLSK
jgi:dienelactone hydrolase